jgi:hypothetical protein
LTPRKDPNLLEKVACGAFSDKAPYPPSQAPRLREARISAVKAAA